MNTSALLLIITSILIFFLWVKSIHYSAHLEYASSPRKAKVVTFMAAFFAGLAVAGHWVVASSGVISDFSQLPPPFAFFFLSLILISAIIAYSEFGNLLIRHISFSWLVGFQGFRILAELVILLAHREGIAPIQMSLEGYNPDIIPAILALALLPNLQKKENRIIIQIWNWMGLASLGIIFFIAITSMPVPFRVFMNEPSNLWVTTTPYVLLPSVLVTAAITGHLLVLRKLRMTQKT